MFDSHIFSIEDEDNDPLESDVSLQNFVDLNSNQIVQGGDLGYEQGHAIILDDADDVDPSECYVEQESSNSHGGESICLSDSLIGLKRENFEDIYDLYSTHAFEVGFSVRRSSTRYTAEGKPIYKTLVCSCEGSRKDSGKTSSLDSGDQGKQKQSYITRSNCKASLRAKYADDGLYEVVQHKMEHNHPLCRRGLSYMCRSQRSISIEKGNAIEDMISSGMTATDSYRYMAHEVGGEHIVGHTKRDHLNFVNRLKIGAIERGDAQTLIEKLQQEGVEDQDFFFRVMLDDEGRLSNVFWRDSMMKEDYRVYGDVVVFDTTYRTNKYNLICAPFVGINNHWKNAMFGCAFISNEKTGSFEWLFETFKKSMEGQSPVTLFTDQDKAISNAIEKVFPTTRHRLCIWHLSKNAQSRLGSLKSDENFNESFQKCLKGCANGEQFENCWKTMISRFQLEDKPWFQRLYDLREKWCNAYNKDFFSAGILSSQRSESTNSALGSKAKKTTSLNDFYKIFRKTVERWRSNESNDEFQCSRGNPTSCLKLKGILHHASQVYTLSLFKDFEREFKESISLSFTFFYEDQDMKFYNVDHVDGITYFVVTFCAKNTLVTCSCKRFDECGVLCCHSLRILHVHSIDKIPECYIKKRWTKFVKEGLWNKHEAESVKSRSYSPWRNQMLRKYYNLVLKAQENEEDRKIIEDGLNSIAADLEASTSTRQTENITEDAESSTLPGSVLDPARSITKGRSQRIKGHLQKSKRKRTNDASHSTQLKEFGSKTPNPKLF